MTDPSSNSSGTYRYDSSNTTVATINGRTITVKGAGTSIITVRQDACGNYTDGSSNITFTVNPKIPIITNFTIPTKTFGDASFAITDPSSNSSGTYRYDSSNTAVATINGKTVTITGAGTTIITARQDACGNYTDGSSNITFTVNKAIPTITNFTIPSKTFGDASFAITDPSSNSSGTYRYDSSNTAVATINGRTITITGPGTSIITAIQDACGNYTDGSANTQFVVQANAAKNSFVLLKNKFVKIIPQKYGIYINNVISWRISPSLPDGLKFSQLTGIINGTPLSRSEPKTYKIWATQSVNDIITTYRKIIQIEIV